MSKKTLNQTNLEALGAARLADLLMEVSTGSAEIKRRLRLELSHNLGAAELAHEVRKRLASLRKSSSFIGWRKRRALIKDLNIQRAMIVDKVAPDDPTVAFDLLWQFVDLAPSLFTRVDDSKGEVADVFRDAMADFEAIAPNAQVDPEELATRVWAVVQDDAVWDGIIPLVAPALGPEGLSALKAHVEGYADAPVATGETHEAIAFLRQLRGGSDYAAKRKAAFVKGCLQEIALASGDASAFIATYSDADLQSKSIAAEVALMMVEEGRAQDAVTLLLDADDDTDPAGQAAWDAAYIAGLSAMGRMEDVQDHRWACFRKTLNPDHLRAYLKSLPDFEDVEAEQTAKEHVLSYPNAEAALRFCLQWPDLVTAAELIQMRPEEVGGENFALLTPAADALRTRHPLAAVQLWRAMITSALEQNRASRYGTAAEHLVECGVVDAQVSDYGDLPKHADFVQTLQHRHGSKSSFWAKMR